MYSLYEPEKVIQALNGSAWARQAAVADLLRTGIYVRCENAKQYFEDCYKLIFDNFPIDVTSYSNKYSFVMAALKKEKECDVDLFDLIYEIFKNLGNQVNRQYLQTYLMDYFPKYLPLLFNKHLTFSNEFIAQETELKCKTLEQLIKVEEMRDEIDVKQYSVFMKVLTHDAFNEVSDCIINWKQNNSSRFIKKLLVYSPEVRKEILERHIKLYTDFRHSQDEYNSVMEAINILYQEEYTPNGWNPLPIMTLEKFVGEDARIRLLHSENENRLGQLT